MVFITRAIFVFLFLYLCPSLGFSAQCNCDNANIKNKEFYQFQFNTNDFVFVGRLEEKIYFTDGEYLAVFAVDEILKISNENAKSISSADFSSADFSEDANIEIIDNEQDSNGKKKIFVKIIGSDYEDECFFNFENYRKYIVFAKRISEGLLFVDICGGTKFFDERTYSFISNQKINKS